MRELRNKLREMSALNLNFFKKLEAPNKEMQTLQEQLDKLESAHKAAKEKYKAQRAAASDPVAKSAECRQVEEELGMLARRKANLELQLFKKKY